MPQCMCGRFFSITTYDIDNKDNDICPKCRDSSAPKSYTSSHQWDCESITGTTIDKNYSGGHRNE